MNIALVNDSVECSIKWFNLRAVYYFILSILVSVIELLQYLRSQRSYLINDGAIYGNGRDAEMSADLNFSTIADMLVGFNHGKLSAFLSRQTSCRNLSRR